MIIKKTFSALNHDPLWHLESSNIVSERHGEPPLQTRVNLLSFVILKKQSVKLAKKTLTYNQTCKKHVM